MNNKSISDFLSTEYKEFAMYVLEGRAIPSVIDSFKPTQRKVIHIASKVWKTGSEKSLKVFQLSGRVASECYYHHGDCLDFDTEVMLDDYSFIKIGDWFEKYPDKEFRLLSYDEKNRKFVPGKGHSPRIGQKTNIEYEIEMEDGNIFKCTENHPFLTKRGWVEAKNLIETDEIISLLDK